jgi:hypothetical protein
VEDLRGAEDKGEKNEDRPHPLAEELAPEAGLMGAVMRVSLKRGPNDSQQDD